MPRLAMARSSWPDTNAEPLSTYTARGTPLADSAVRSAGLQAHRVFREPPAIADQHSAVVVDEREQVGSAAADGRAVQRVAGPQVVRAFGLEPPERPGRCPVGSGVEPQPGEQALHRAPGGAIALGGADDLGHLRGRAFRDLALEAFGHLELGERGDRLAVAGVGGQRLEATETIGADPTVDGVAGHPHPAPARPGVITPGQITHQLAPLRSAERRVGGVADQRVAEQGDLSLTVLHGLPPW